MAVNEIILESVLKLNEIGKENKTRNLTTMNQFLFRNVDFLIRFHFDTNGSKVTFEILSFESLHNLIKYMNNEIAKNRESFVIYEMDEKEIDPVIDMPFLLSTVYVKVHRVETCVKQSRVLGKTTEIFIYTILCFISSLSSS